MPPVHDYVIANGTGAAVRSDLNDALAAIVSNNSSSSEPATTYAYQWWADTTANVLKIRNSANNAWITLRELDGTLLMEDGSNSAPGLSFASDTNTGFFSGGADKIGFATGGVERLEIGSSEVVFNDPSNDVDFRVESNGQTHMLFVDAGNDRVGIGTSSPDSLLDVENSSGAAEIQIKSLNASDCTLAFGDNADTDVGRIRYAHSDNAMLFFTAATERARIDSSGRLLIGVSSSRSVGFAHTLQIEGTDAATSTQSFVRNSNDSSGPQIDFAKTRGTSTGSNTVVQDNDTLGTIKFRAADGTDTASTAAEINGIINGTPGSNDTPGSLLFKTCADGAASPTERLRIDSSGNVGLGTTSPSDHNGFTRILDISGSGGGAVYCRTGTSSSNVAIFGQSGSDVYVVNKASGNTRFFVADAEKMRLDTSGRLLLGATSQSGVTHKASFHNSGSNQLSLIDTSSQSTDAGAGIALGGNYRSTGDAQAFVKISASKDNATDNDYGYGMRFFTTSNGGSAFNVAAMKIDSSGAVLINRTSKSDSEKLSVKYPPANQGVIIDTDAAFTGNSVLMEFKANGTTGGSIAFTNNGTSTAYVGSSDYRLKENVVDLVGAITRVKQLSPKRFNFIADANTTVDGFLAHEAQTVVPEAVTGTHNEVDDDGNAVMQGIDQSKLVPLLTAALQEAIAKIETLETKVAALEAG